MEHGFATVGALADVPRPAAASELRVVLELARAREAISREDADLGAAQAAGRMSADRFESFSEAVHIQRAQFASAVDDLQPADAAAYHRILNGPAYRARRSAEDAVRAAGAGVRAATAVPAGRWDTTTGTVLRDLRAAQRSAATTATRSATPLSLDTLGGSGLAVVLGLAGVLLSLLISVKIGRPPTGRRAGGTAQLRAANRPPRPACLAPPALRRPARRHRRRRAPGRRPRHRPFGLATSRCHRRGRSVRTGTRPGG
ncbi:nitrate- and nitrite sensing domain-containing protein [Streptomyces sp. NPDC059649]|uniref:nitrate- and nitrite sensing domain-containing protein n=1 Tax=Streptomyces sp. NPDC059649 TaxID=3346895 RepID=UPI0036BA81D6